MYSKNEKSSCDEVGFKEMIIGGIIGGAIGASLALLLAPKTGAETRRDFSVKELVNNGVDKVKDTAAYFFNKDSEPFS
ncbi:YtxH domain-containing protein [Sporolactobacillus sp. CPB3-1]|uniref:YtxH domain-containing protein n=1 Tax=Sporolactobacillus mangiferae TaxID=2940498 RepID=A0ABT0M808_9BACL|nr:YtxH domain-containing protein [Sporolactobacillus mangiferae]MCL1631001.1 YtxH domain-containing protein [Sporolactobacillus mangiferae]